MMFSTIKAIAKMETKQVLILHSYHRELGWTDSISKGIDETFDNSEYQIETFTEYMDTKRIFNEKYLGDFAALLKYKYRNHQFDVIISSDDHAFQFLRSHHDSIFPNTPVVFCGVNYFKDEFISSTPYFTGVVESISIKETIDAALIINPNLRQVYTIVDKTVTGTANLKLLESVMPVFKNRLEFITITEKDMTEVTKEVRHLPPESIILLLAFTSDRSGNKYSLEQSADLITAASNRPVYSFWDFSLNHGIVGGMLTTGLSQGMTASKLALRIIGGEHTSEIKVVKTSPNRYIFDYKVLNKFGIPIKRLPPNYSLINHPISFYEQYKLLIWCTVIVFCLLLLAFLGVAFGLARSRQAEEALKEKTKFLDQIIESSALSMWISDEKGTVIKTNPACLEFFGATEEELVGKYNLFKDTVIEKKGFMPVVKGVFEKGKPASLVIDYDFGAVDHVDVKNATHKTIKTVLTPVLDNYKKVSNVIVQAIDITDLKRSEEEKIRVNKIMAEHEKLSLIGQVAGKMAHDFNNILGIIMGNSELALIDCPDDQTKKTLELIYNQTIRGKNLTRNLVAFAKDQEPKQEFFSIDEKMDLVLNLLKKDLEGINVMRRYSHGIPDLLADSGMIEHAMVNLVQNSVHALSLTERPEMIVHTYHQGELVFIEIEDNGCGIPPDSLGEIYEPSFTLKGSKDKTGMYKPDIKGTGYGMSNVKKYIEQHKGSISIHSELQKGTKITITLPVTKKELTNEEIQEVKKEKISFEKYILIVEDEQDISDVQYNILTHKPCNHKVDIANNGQVALDLMNRNTYDLISLDYVLPGKFNGMEVYHHVRKKNKSIPILFISGNIEFLESIKDLKKKDLYIDHLSKPCKNIDYLNGIKQLFENTAI